MTDTEISAALAIAIGYLPEHVRIVSLPYRGDAVFVFRPLMQSDFDGLQYSEFGGMSPAYMLFDYKMWPVIGPIAAKHNVFPFQWNDGRWGAPRFCTMHYADTPQKAIALAVIGAKP